MTDVPHLHATLASGINVLGGVADGHGAHDFTVSESVDLTSVSRYAGAHERVRRKRYRLHLTFGAHVKRIRPTDRTREKTKKTRYYYYYSSLYTHTKLAQLFSKHLRFSAGNSQPGPERRSHLCVRIVTDLCKREREMIFFAPHTRRTFFFFLLRFSTTHQRCRSGVTVQRSCGR